MKPNERTYSRFVPSKGLRIAFFYLCFSICEKEEDRNEDERKRKREKEGESGRRIEKGERREGETKKAKG